MDSGIFKHWCTNILIPEVHENNGGRDERNLLLLDNASSHPTIEELKEIALNCDVLFLPPIVTALIQPIDQGVIECLKRAYRKLYCQEMIFCNTSVPHNIDEFAKQGDLLKIISIVSNAWECVQKMTLPNAGNNVLKGESLPADDIHVEFITFVNKAMSDNFITDEAVE